MALPESVKATSQGPKETEMVSWVGSWILLLILHFSFSQSSAEAVYYSIRSVSSGKALDVRDLSTSNGASIQVWDFLGGANQCWELRSIDGRYCNIVAKHSGKGLDVPTATGEVVHQWELHGGTNQMWEVVFMFGGKYYIRSKQSGKALAVTGNNNGAAVVQQGSWLTVPINQMWIFQPGCGESPAVVPPLPFDPSRNFYHLIAKHSGKAADVQESRFDNGANVHQWSPHSGLNQQWELKPVGGGCFILRARHSGKVMEARDGSLLAGALVQQWDWYGADHQQFQLIPIGDEFYIIKAKHSHKVLDVKEGSTGNGAVLHLWDYLNYDNQKWRLVREPSDADLDKDTIPDETEAYLLSRYRPLYRFSRSGGVNEEYLPTDVVWYLQRSEVLVSGDEDSKVLVPNSKLKESITNLLTGRQCFDEKYCTSSHWYNRCGYLGFGFGLTEATRTACRESGSLKEFRGDSQRNINPIDTQYHNVRQGSGWKDGLYGHVARKDKDSQYSVEFWQFFAYNDALHLPGDLGNHEGDWCLLKVYVDTASLELRRARYYHHGDYTEVSPREMTFHLQTHPVVYVEHGAHEFWPSPNGLSLAMHGGDGEQVFPDPPPNLGEVGAPLGEVANVILHFNGKWGAFSRRNSPPKGPPMHGAWNWVHSKELKPADSELEGKAD